MKLQTAKPAKLCPECLTLETKLLNQSILSYAGRTCCPLSTNVSRVDTEQRKLLPGLTTLREAIWKYVFRIPSSYQSQHHCFC